MKKTIVIVSLLNSLLFAEQSNEDSVQVFVSKTMNINEVGVTEELFTGTEEEFSKNSSNIFNKESEYVASKQAETGIKTSDIAAHGVISSLPVFGSAMANGGLSTLGNSNNGGLIGLAVIGTAVASTAIFNATKGLREDKKYISLYRNTVNDKMNLIYVYVVSNGELKKEEVQKIASAKIKG